MECTILRCENTAVIPPVTLLLMSPSATLSAVTAPLALLPRLVKTGNDSPTMACLTRIALSSFRQQRNCVVAEGLPWRSFLMISVARRMRLRALPRFAVGSSRLIGAVLSQRGILGHFLRVQQICNSNSPGLTRRLIPRVSLHWCRLAITLCGASFS